MAKVPDRASLEPRKQRLEAMRRARARMIMRAEEPAPKPSRWHLFGHPVIVGVIAAAIGLASGLITSSVNSDRQLDQYWREQRLQVYSDFFRAVESLEESERIAQYHVDHHDAQGVAVTSYDKEELEEQAEEIHTLYGSLDDMVTRITVLGSEDVVRITQDIHSAQSELHILYTRALYDLQYENGKVQEQTRSRLPKARDSYVDRSSDRFLEMSRNELGLRRN